jgi:cation diffusion facilitator CzcD-associated flavoprotein CzcO
MAAISNALIVGGGAAGLTAATLLSARGIDAEIARSIRTCSRWARA